MKDEKDFFKGITDTLQNYEEAYAPGAWEAFRHKRERKPRGILFLKIGSAAAILLLVSYAAFMFWAKTPATTNLAGNKPPVQPAVTKGAPSSAPQTVQPSAISPASPSVQQPTVAAKKSIVNQSSNYTPQTIGPVNTAIVVAKANQNISNNPVVNYPLTTKPDSTFIANQSVPPVKPGAVNSGSQNQLNPAIVKPLPGTVADKAIAGNSKPANTDKPVYDNLINSRKNRVAAAAEKNSEDKTLSYSVVVQPGIGNQKLNMGTGVQVAYKLNDKISITSGVSYSSLSATAAGGTANARLGNVQNVNLAVSGVEIPLGVQYKTDKGYYVSAGVMGMSVTSNSLQYNYITQNTLASTMFDKQGMAYNGLSVVSENKTEESKEKVANYLGFYILQAGKKQPIGKKNTIIFGPFLRVPFGAVSSEKIRLLQGGVTVGLGF